MRKAINENNKNTFFYIVLGLFLISFAVLVFGLTRPKSGENEKPVAPSDQVIEEESTGSLKEYFDGVPLTSGSEDSDLYYLETDPYKENCQNEGGTFGTVCYY